MIVAVIGANGRTGRKFVKAALDAGMTVRAGVRGPHNLEEHERMIVVACDALSKSEINNLITGSDAVVSLLGHGPGSSATVQKTATEYALSAMKEHGVRRFVSLTGTGVQMPGDRPRLMERLLNYFISAVDPERVRDGVAHARVMMASDRDWTLIRAVKLTNGRHHGEPVLSINDHAELFTPRERLAAALVRLLQNNEFIKQAPVITGTK